MALAPVSLALRPGVDTTSTPFQSSGELSASNLIRYLNGQIQKLGGSQAIPGSGFSGIASAVLPFADLAGGEYIAIGSSAALELFTSPPPVTDITPAAGPGSGDWSLDKFGQDLIAANRGSTVYQWVPPIAGGNIATPVTNAPLTVNGLIVAAPQQMVVTWGAYSATLGMQDALLVAWCDIANLNVWTADVTNQAGTFRIPHGSTIQAVMWPGLSGLLWTDIDLWAVTYVSYPLVYGFNNLAQNCGLVSRRAVTQLGQVIAWMSQKNFYIFRGGAVQPLVCSVYDFIWDNIDRDHLDKVHACSNSYYNEITWRFPVAGSGGVCTAYVKATWAGEQVLWDFGNDGPNISAWTDESILGSPIGADYTSILSFFEAGVADWNNNPYDSGFLSGWFYLQESHVSVFLERIRPDFLINPGGEIELSVIFADEIPHDDTDYPVRTYGPYPINSTTPFVIVRGSGSVARIRVSCTVPGTFWRYGKPIAVITPDGHR